MKIVETRRTIPKSASKEEMEKKVKELRKSHEKMVKGKFEFIDAQGGWIDFYYRFFPSDPIMTITLVHGEVCELPMGIVKHINNTVKKIRKISPVMKETDRGVPSTYEIQSRIRFTPVDYI